MRNQRKLIHTEPWNTIYIMDAMRFDAFQGIIEEDQISGKLEKVLSPGCETGMWMRNTFTKKQYKEIVLVSNSVIYWKDINRHILPKFFKKVPLWKGWRTKARGATQWGAVMPTTEVLEHAEKEHIINTKKKLIIHDLPPHLPFCDEKGLAFTKKLMPKRSGSIATALGHYGRRAPHYWEEIRGYYKQSARETLQTILNCEWLQKRGNLIITSDHGEMIGEGGHYGHSLNYKDAPVLRHVPWFEPYA